MKQVGIGLQNYHDTYKTLPSGNYDLDTESGRRRCTAVSTYVDVVIAAVYRASHCL